MNFQVPQFIEIEDKIFGPLSFKQFLYVAGGAGLGFIIYSFLPIYIAIIPILAVVGFGLALAFLQINNRPFIFAVESFVRYLIGSKLYIWKKGDPTKDIKKATSGATINPAVPRLAHSKLKDLAWSLDVKEKVK